MRYLLAPLAGFTDAPFRRLVYEGGADLTYTEMVSAAGLFHGSKSTRELMETMHNEGPVALQLFGAKEDELAFAASEAPKIFKEVNLNAGCPMKKVTVSGAGAKLMEDPEKVYRLLCAMVKSTSLPVTLKARLGPNPKKVNIFEILDAAERAGVKGMILHARYTSQMHGGPTDLTTLAEVVAKAKIPITGNGSIVDTKSATEMAKTGVAAIMIGRAALANPAIFATLKGLKNPFLGMSIVRRHLDYLLEFREQLTKKYEHVPSVDGYAAVKMHIHLFRYFSGRPGAAALRARLNSVRTLAEINDIISSL